MNADKDTEATHLPTHVALCHQRYSTLTKELADIKEEIRALRGMPEQCATFDTGIIDLKDQVKSLRNLLFVMLAGIVVELIAVALYIGSQ